MGGVEGFTALLEVLSYAGVEGRSLQPRPKDWLLPFFPQHEANALYRETWLSHKLWRCGLGVSEAFTSM